MPPTSSQTVWPRRSEAPRPGWAGAGPGPRSQGCRFFSRAKVIGVSSRNLAVLSQSTNNRKKAGLGLGVGGWVGGGSWHRRGPTLWAPAPSSPPCFSASRRSEPASGGGGGGRGGALAPPRHPPHLPLIARGRPEGVCASASLFHLALQLNPLQTRGALTRRHDEAESEADTASCWLVSLSRSPSP